MTVLNRAPAAGEPIEDIEVVVGEVAQVDVSSNFSDPDGDALSYAAAPSDSGVATASVSGSAVLVSGVSRGTADVTATATDPGGLSAVHVFTVTVRLTERQVLEILYDQLDGDNWTDNTNRLTDAPLEEWYGVGTGADGRVDTLHLADNQLTGAIPPELGNLSNLRYLSLAGNELTGEIPSELGNLSNLRDLYLAGNELTGEIPSELGELSNLERLSLRRNSLTGEIPRDFLDLSSLRYFYWNDNDGLCAPDTSEFDEWLGGLVDWLGPRCD